MRHYTLKQINQIKQEIRTGKPISLIAEDLSTEWQRSVGGVYSKVWQLAKQTRKITTKWDGPTRRSAKRSKAIVMDPLPGSLWDIVPNGEIVEQESIPENIESVQDSADICIEVPTGNISFVGTPSRIVIYGDHVRYYYNN